MGNVGDQVTLQKTLSAANLPPGLYKIEIKVNDKLSKQTVDPDGDFRRGITKSKLFAWFPGSGGRMFRRLGFLEIVAVMVTSMALPAWSGTVRGATSGTISGYVRDASGAPQMGAVVEVLSSAAPRR